MYLRIITLLLLMSVFNIDLIADNNFHNGLARFSNNNKWGFIDKTGALKIPVIYDEVNDFSEGMAAVRMGNDWGFVDAVNPSKNIAPQYIEVKNFHEGLAAVKVGTLWGYINKDNTMVIKPSFNAAGDFSESLAPATDLTSFKMGFIDKKGAEQIPFIYEFAREFKNGMASVTIKVGIYDKMGFIEKSSKKIKIPAKYVDTGDFSENFANVRVKNKWGFVHKSDPTKNIAPQFDSVGNFHEGLAPVLIGTNWGYIDYTGTLKIPAQFDEAEDFHEGLAKIHKGKYGFIDNTGTIIIKPSFDSVENFNEDIAVIHSLPVTFANLTKTWGYLDNSNQTFIRIFAYNPSTNIFVPYTIKNP